jgi:hypothetical protein
MAHFAKIENNIVTQIIVVDNADIQDLEFPASEAVGIAYLQSIGHFGNWLQASYNGKFRKNYPGLGYSYVIDIDAFIPPQPYPSWVLNPATGMWCSPVLYPTDCEFFHWDEKLLTWVKDE